MKCCNRTPFILMSPKEFFPSPKNCFKLLELMTRLKFAWRSLLLLSLFVVHRLNLVFFFFLNVLGQLHFICIEIYVRVWELLIQPFAENTDSCGTANSRKNKQKLYKISRFLVWDSQIVGKIRSNLAQKCIPNGTRLLCLFNWADFG